MTGSLVGVLLSEETRLIVTLPNAAAIGRELQLAEERRIAHVEVGIDQVLVVPAAAFLPTDT